jgi:hypothetical protein
MPLKQIFTENSTSLYTPTTPENRSTAATQTTHSSSLTNPTTVEASGIMAGTGKTTDSRRGGMTPFLLTGLSWAAIFSFGLFCLAHLLFETPLSLSAMRAAVVAYSVASLFCLFPVRRLKARRYLTTVLGLVTLAGITWIPNGSPRQRFLMDFERIQPGMTVVEVQDRLSDYPLVLPYPGVYDTVPGDFTGTLRIQSHTPEDGRYNADSASIEVESGRVVRTAFSLD